MDISKIVRKHLLDLKPYSSARDEYSGKEGIFLDANENPFASVNNKPYNRYPDPYQWEVKTKLAKLKNVKPENIFLGNGSDEPIDLLIKAVCEPIIDNILIMPPTYGMYKVCADIQQVNIQEAPLNSDFDIDLDNVFDSVNTATKIIWICSPNNPSGNLLNQESILQIIKAFPNKLVVVDEAYIDFSETDSFLKFLDVYPNLVVLQTFSKAWGMAGLRIGVAYLNIEILKILNKIKYPYNINQLTQQELLLSLENENIKNKYVSDILTNKDILIEKIKKISGVVKIFPSDSNMLLIKFNYAHNLFKYLLENKMIVRDRSNVLLCEDCLRITIGTQSENQALVSQIESYYK